MSLTIYSSHILPHSDPTTCYSHDTPTLHTRDRVFLSLYYPLRLVSSFFFLIYFFFPFPRQSPVRSGRLNWGGTVIIFALSPHSLTTSPLPFTFCNTSLTSLPSCHTSYRHLQGIYYSATPDSSSDSLHPPLGVANSVSSNSFTHEISQYILFKPLPQILTPTLSSSACDNVHLNV